MDAGDIEDMGQVSGLGNHLEKGMATHSNILAGKSHGQRSLVGYSRWGHKETDMTEHAGTQAQWYNTVIKIIWVKLQLVQSLSRVPLFVTPWTAACQASLSIINSQSLLKLMPIESAMPSNHLILCHPLFLPPSIFPNIRVFSNESALPIMGPKYWSFSFSISPSNEHPRLISFRMDWLDLLAVQEIPKSLLQHHSSKASILRYSAFFTVQLSHPYMTTGKTIALTRWTFVGKVMSLLFNMLSRLVITFLSRSVFLFHGCSHPLQWFWSPTPTKKCQPLFPHLFAMKWWDQNHNLRFLNVEL